MAAVMKDLERSMGYSKRSVFRMFAALPMGGVRTLSFNSPRYLKYLGRRAITA